MQARDRSGHHLYDESMQRQAAAPARGRRQNQRGASTRMHLLDVSLRLLSTGRPEAVSVNLVAREAGVTWGTVQYQFGDADGLWAATLDHLLLAGGPAVWFKPSANSIPGRVRAVINMAWSALNSPYYTARTNLEFNLARSHEELIREFPRTATTLDAIDGIWKSEFAALFGDLPAKRSSIARVCAFLPTTLRSMHAAYTYGSPFNVNEALAGLCDVVTAYLVANS